MTVVVGDITTIKADAIVNAANESLLGGGGVDGAIHRAAGPELLEECKTLGGCSTGSSKITKAYKLPAKYVIHAVGPYYSDYEPYEAEQLLTNAYKSIMQHAAEHPDIKTMTIPAISCGIFHFPLRTAVNIAVKTISDYAPESLQEVIFVVSSDYIADEYLDRLQNT